MKTLTELSGTLIRMAAAAIAEAKRTLPAEPPATPEAAAPPAAVEASPAEGAPPAAAPEAEPAKAEKAAPSDAESEPVKAALDEAVGKATGLSGDRLARLRDAVKVVGPKTADVRLVRVFGAEEPVPGAKALNGFQYLVDHAPATMRQETGPKKERFGRGGGRGGRGGGGGKGAPASGGFSMDAMKEDRKGSRGPGGGRGRPGGGGGPRR